MVNPPYPNLTAEDIASLNADFAPRSDLPTDAEIEELKKDPEMAEYIRTLEQIEQEILKDTETREKVNAMYEQLQELEVGAEFVRDALRSPDALPVGRDFSVTWEELLRKLDLPVMQIINEVKKSLPEPLISAIEGREIQKVVKFHLKEGCEVLLRDASIKKLDPGEYILVGLMMHGGGLFIGDKIASKEIRTISILPAEALPAV